MIPAIASSSSTSCTNGINTKVVAAAAASIAMAATGTSGANNCTNGCCSNNSLYPPTFGSGGVSPEKHLQHLHHRHTANSSSSIISISSSNSSGSSSGHQHITGDILDILFEKGSVRRNFPQSLQALESLESLESGHLHQQSLLNPKRLLKLFIIRRRRSFLAFFAMFAFCFLFASTAYLISQDRFHPCAQAADLHRLIFGVTMPSRATCSEDGPFEHQLTLFAIFRDADIYLKEWIEFHRLVGFDHFLMYNNNSTDNFRAVLQPYVDMGIMTLLDFPTVYTYDVAGHRIINTQKEGLIDGIMRFRCKTRWMGVFDIDEFFFATDPKITNLQDLLPSYMDTCGGVGAWRLNFGSNNHKNRPKGLVTESYTRRHPVTWTGKKILFNPRKVAGLHNTHNFYFYDGLPLCDEAKRPQTVSFFRDLEEVAIREVNVLRINHYFTKSFEDWAARLKRGTVSGNNAEFGWHMFLEGDNNDLLDESISRFLPALRKSMQQP